jgi:toxin-antitoxin system PIN domain toxin
VILLDVNLLLYAHNSGAREHKRAATWLEAAISGTEMIGLSWETILGFLRIATTPKLFAMPREIDEIIQIVDAWLVQENVVLVTPGDRHWPIFRDLLPKSQARGPLIMDAHLAALAIEHGATLCTNDRDFMRFPGLKVEFPLQ